jgi:DNA-binding transcriptional LysR family regulator
LQSLREIFLTTSDLGLTRQLLKSTDMIALLPQPVVQTELETGLVCLLPGLQDLPALRISGVVATREDRPLSPAAAQLSRIVLDIAEAGWQQYLTRSQA